MDATKQRRMILKKIDEMVRFSDRPYSEAWENMGKMLIELREKLLECWDEEMQIGLFDKGGSEK